MMANYKKRRLGTLLWVVNFDELRYSKYKFACDPNENVDLLHGKFLYFKHLANMGRRKGKKGAYDKCIEEK